MSGIINLITGKPVLAVGVLLAIGLALALLGQGTPGAVAIMVAGILVMYHSGRGHQQPVGPDD